MAEINNLPLLNKINDIDKNEIPPWALILLESIKTVLNALDNLQIMSKKYEEIESIAIVSKATSEALRSELVNANSRIKELEGKMDDQEQRSRNQCLLFHGITECEGEDTDEQVIKLCDKHLNVNLQLDSIARSHRLGPRRQAGRNTRSKPEKPRPIIVRFSNYRVRQQIFTIKKKLKGKAFSISENLTKRRMDLLNKCNEKFGKGKCWTQEGRIITKINNSFLSILSEEDL